MRGVIQTNHPYTIIVHWYSVTGQVFIDTGDYIFNRRLLMESLGDSYGKRLTLVTKSTLHCVEEEISNLKEKHPQEGGSKLDGTPRGLRGQLVHTITEPPYVARVHFRHTVILLGSVFSSTSIDL